MKNYEGKRVRVILQSWVTVLLLALGCLFTEVQFGEVNPVTGRFELVLVGQDEEIRIGNELYQQMIEESGGAVTDQPEVSAYVWRVGNKIASHSDRPDLPFEFVIIDNDMPNAWALPGGKIAINRGLLTMLDSEAELASVIAHEVAHATARHTAQRIERDMLLESVQFVEGVSTPFGLATSAIPFEFELAGFKYNRDIEREADIYGMEYLSRAGYNVQAAVDTHHKLKAYFSASESPTLVDQVFATHPDDDERIETGRTLATKYPSGGFDGLVEYQTIKNLL